MAESACGKGDGTIYFARKDGRLLFEGIDGLTAVKARQYECERCRAELSNQLVMAYCGHGGWVIIPENARGCARVYIGKRGAAPVFLRETLETGQDEFFPGERYRDITGKIARCRIRPGESGIVTWLDFADKAGFDGPVHSWAGARGMDVVIVYNGCPEFYRPLLGDAYDALPGGLLPEDTRIGEAEALEAMKAVDPGKAESFDFSDLRALEAELAARKKARQK
jgi:hypothetical protein